MAEGNSEGQGGGWDAALSEQLAQPFQVYKAGPPRKPERPGTQERTTLVYVLLP